MLQPAALVGGSVQATPRSDALRERGATVTGIDSSAEMLRPARRRLGAGATLHLGDLARPLPFPDGAFDDIVASATAPG